MPFDRGVAFSVMKKETYEKKLKDLLQAEQYSERKNLTGSAIMKIEKRHKQGITCHEKQRTRLAKRCMLG